MPTTDQMMSGAFGSAKIESGATLVSVPSFGFQAWENTTFGVFKNDKGVEFTNGWTGKVLEAGFTALFGPGVASYTITVGGKGQTYKSK